MQMSFSKLFFFFNIFGKLGPARQEPAQHKQRCGWGLVQHVATLLGAPLFPCFLLFAFVWVVLRLNSCFSLQLLACSPGLCVWTWGNGQPAAAGDHLVGLGAQTPAWEGEEGSWVLVEASSLQPAWQQLA